MGVLLQVEELTKSFGYDLLFGDISFGLDEGDKVGLIAKNGTGKSTLLNLLAGVDTPDSGTIIYRNDVRLGYLPQTPTFEGAKTVIDACLEGDDPRARAVLAYERAASSGDGDALTAAIQAMDNSHAWDYEERFKQVLTKLKIDDFTQRVSELSGGQIKRVALAKILIDEPEFLILDEPTNHLDIDMIEWLEEFLSRQRLALLMVTHDRYFLDNVCQDIYELDNARLYHYKGHYDYYLEKKAEREANERAEVAKARSLYRTELEWMRRMPQARGTKAQARIDAFYELEAKAHTRFDDSRPQLTVKTERIGGKILELYNICYRDIIDDYSYVFKRGEKIGIVGPNGVGKSTFLNIITERLKPTSGRVVVGQTIQFGYYTQAGMSAPPDRRVIDLVKDIAEEIELDNGKSMSAHQFLTYFGFDGTTQFNYFGNLSGGEKRRLYLLQVLMANPNFLILDEPTNDLDIYTLQILEQFLQTYKGCLVIVSHDRSFMDHIVDHLLVFEGNGKIRDYHSNYTQYRLERQRRERAEMLEQRERKAADRQVNTERPTPTTKKKATYKEQKEYEALTAEIETLTAEKATLEQQLGSGTLTDPAAITNASTRIGEVIALLDEKEMRWLELDEIIN